MRSLACYCVIFSGAIAGATSLKGVPEALQHLYEPRKEDPSKWACLGDPSIILDYSQINDDYCDCPDGSDEPGTSACGSLSRFYCPNTGFAPRYVSGFKVNDGVCDCCDCSDEPAFLESKLPGENSCSTLRSQFEEVLRQELDEHKRGTDVLKKLAAQHGVDTSNNALNSNTSFLQEKKSEIDELEARLKTCVSNLAQAKEIYKQRLQNENPLMLRLEQADVPFIVNTIEMIFTEAQSTSEAYQDLVSLMDTLGYKYNKNLNDEVVNRNVQEYLNFIDDHRDRLNVSPKLDQTQREQITTYLNEELPSMFLAGSSHMPSAAIIGKFRMAKTLAEVRMKYRNDVSAVLKRLTEIMDDIAENYNVNFQDPGVKNAVSSYRDLLAKNSRFLETVEIPEQYLKKVSELEILVEDASTKLLTPSTDSSFSLLSSVSSVLQKLGTLFGLGGSNLETLKSQIVKQNVECASFRKDFRAKAQEYQILKEEATHSGSEHESMDSGTNVAVSALLNEGSLDCVEQKVDNYIYQICMNKRDGAVIQKEDKPGGKSVLIGRFEDYRFDAEEAWERYLDDMRIKYSETDLISHLESDQGNYKFEPLVGNLPRKNSGLSIEYSGGDRCWNGPLRSAQVFFRCSDNFRLNSVHERTKCHYILDVSAPLGCSMLFKYEAPDWF